MIGSEQQSDGSAKGSGSAFMPTITTSIIPTRTFSKTIPEWAHVGPVRSAKLKLELEILEYFLQASNN